MMARKRDDDRGTIGGMSYGKIMTALLIPKDSRTNPRRVLSGIAFLAFICLFVFGATYRSCVRDEFGCRPPGAEQSAPAAQSAPAPPARGGGD